MLSISIYYNAYHFIESHNRVQYKKFLQILVFIVSGCLFVTGAINMHYWIHNVVAAVYFFAYPLAIFLLAHFNRKHLQYKEWKTHLLISVAMVICPLLFIELFHGMAIPETIHCCIVMSWNLWILLEE